MLWPCSHLGWVSGDVWGGVFFFPLLQVSFIITHAFSDMEKTFLTSNTLLLLTMSKHLVFTSFPPPNCFAVRNSFPPHHLLPLLPTPPLAGQASPAVVRASSSPGADAACSRRAWHKTPRDTGSPPPAFGTVEMSLWPQQKRVWKLQAAAMEQAGSWEAGSTGLQAAVCRTGRGGGVMPRVQLATRLSTQTGVLLAGWGPAWILGSLSSPAPGRTPPGKAPGIPAPAG